MPAIARQRPAQQTFVSKFAHTAGIGTPITHAFEVWTAMLRDRSGGRFDARTEPLSYFARLLADVRDRTTTAMPAGHALTVIRLAITAQLRAQAARGPNRG